MNLKSLLTLTTPKPFQTPTAGFVVFCCTQYCIALTEILYMGPGVPVPAKSNSCVVVLLYGVGIWQIQEGS